MIQTNLDPQSIEQVPDQIEAEHFDHPIYAQVADVYWAALDRSKSMPRLVDAFADVVEHMEPSELLDLASLVEGSFPKVQSDRDLPIESMWSSEPISIDEEGLVHGVFGNISRVREYVLQLTGSASYDYATELNEYFGVQIYKAAEKQGGEGFAVSVSTALANEEARRLDV